MSLRNQLKEAVSRFLTNAFTSPKLMVFFVARNSRIFHDVVVIISTETMTLHTTGPRKSITETLSLLFPRIPLDLMVGFLPIC